MEPRSFKRGNVDVQRRCVGFDEASMEPRSFKRGNHRQKLIQLSEELSFNGATFIQTWKPFFRGLILINGRSFNVSHVHSNVETGKPSKKEWLSAKLQWSHVHSNVETYGPAERTPRLSVCFNGATFIQTWKLLMQILLPIAYKLLQWSHVHSNVETPPANSDQIIDLAGFNGATFIQTWKPGALNLYTPLPICFNGATFIQTWKLAANLRPGWWFIGFNGATFIQTWKPSGRFAHRRYYRGFNGATFIQTWKRRNGWNYWQQVATLQWSHVHSNVETWLAPQKGDISDCFNGATFIQTWKP